jgi:hypothetical protein
MHRLSAKCLTAGWTTGSAMTRNAVANSHATTSLSEVCVTRLTWYIHPSVTCVLTATTFVAVARAALAVCNMRLSSCPRKNLRAILPHAPVRRMIASLCICESRLRRALVALELLHERSLDVSDLSGGAPARRGSP